MHETRTLKCLMLQRRTYQNQQKIHGMIFRGMTKPFRGNKDYKMEVSCDETLNTRLFAL